MIKKTLLLSWRHWLYHHYLSGYWSAEAAVDTVGLLLAATGELLDCAALACALEHIFELLPPINNYHLKILNLYIILLLYSNKRNIFLRRFRDHYQKII
jgi:hypothetical protein